jgi:hypothetical protein
VIEQRLRESSAAWFPPAPSLAADVLERVSAAPDRTVRRHVPRRVLAVAIAVLVLCGTAVAASWLDLVPGVRIRQVERLPEVGYVATPFGEETTLAGARARLGFEVVLPTSLGDPDTLLLDRDREGSPVLTAVYGDDERARLVLTQWPASAILFDKLLTFATRSEYVDVDGAPGIWIEGDDHEVFYLGRSTVEENRVGGYLTGNVLIWQRGRLSYRLELGTSRERALDVARSLRPPT